MNRPFEIAAIHHVTLTVSDVARSADFYTRHLGFKVLLDLGARQILGNGRVVLAVTLPSDPAAPIPANDSFSENRVGLDHVSFGLGSLTELEAAAAYFDAQGISRGDIRDLSAAGLPISVMAFRDPDHIQLEMTAPNDSVG